MAARRHRCDTSCYCIEHACCKHSDACPCLYEGGDEDEVMSLGIPSESVASQAEQQDEVGGGDGADNMAELGPARPVQHVDAIQQGRLVEPEEIRALELTKIGQAGAAAVLMLVDARDTLMQQLENMFRAMHPDCTVQQLNAFRAKVEDPDVLSRQLVIQICAVGQVMCASREPEIPWGMSCMYHGICSHVADGCQSVFGGFKIEQDPIVGRTPGIEEHLDASYAHGALRLILDYGLGPSVHPAMCEKLLKLFVRMYDFLEREDWGAAVKPEGFLSFLGRRREFVKGYLFPGSHGISREGMIDLHQRTVLPHFAPEVPRLGYMTPVWAKELNNAQVDRVREAMQSAVQAAPAVPAVVGLAAAAPLAIASDEQEAPVPAATAAATPAAVVPSAAAAAAVTEPSPGDATMSPGGSGHLMPRPSVLDRLGPVNSIEECEPPAAERAQQHWPPGSYIPGVPGNEPSPYSRIDRYYVGLVQKLMLDLEMIEVRIGVPDPLSRAFRIKPLLVRLWGPPCVITYPEMLQGGPTHLGIIVPLPEMWSCALYKDGFLAHDLGPYWPALRADPKYKKEVASQFASQSPPSWC